MNFIQKLAIAIRFIGLKSSLLTVPYTLKKERLNRFDPEQAFAQNTLPGHLTHTFPLPGGGRFSFAHADLEICFLAPDLVRFTWGRGPAPVPYALERQEWVPIPAQMRKKGENWLLETAGLNIEIEPDGSLRFFDSLGRTLRQELPPVFQGHCWKSRAILKPEEHIYGLGETSGPLNLRGSERRMWNSDPGGSYGPNHDPLYMPMPVYLGLHSQGSYLIFYENSYPGTFEIQEPVQRNGQNPGEPSLMKAAFLGGQYRCYFVPGPPRRALERFSELTGRSPLPPRWSLGYHQSRWGYKTADDVRSVAAGFAKYEMPLSAIHLDIDYMDGYRVFTIDRSRFPDLCGLSEELESKGIRLVTIIDPGVKQDANYAVYREGLEKGYFCTGPDGRPMLGIAWPTWSAFPDFTNPLVRQWWGSLYESLLENGISGFWHDMNEPTSFTAWGDMSLPLAMQHNMEGKQSDHQQGHNLYGLLMNRAAFEALRRLRPHNRPWIVSRSGWVSQARYAWNWSGDTASSWDALRMTIATVLGLSLSGQPYCGPDIGGFNGEPTPEMHLRHFQMATFLPFFRTHSAIGSGRREPWVYGEPYTSIMRSFLQLRQRLMPYLYTLAYESSQNGHPLVRPLFWGHEGDRSLWDIDDAFLLGEALLVAPVLEPEQEQRKVRLPSGCWYHFWDDRLFKGSSVVELPTPLEHIPLLVRAGSLLPIDEGEELALHIYAPGENVRLPAQLLFSDAGDGYGSRRVDRFTLEEDSHSLTLDWEAEGDYPFPYRQIKIILHGFHARQAKADGSLYPVKENYLLLPSPVRSLRFQAT